MKRFINGKNFSFNGKTIAYHSCPKNGCTSVKTMILRIFGDNRTNKLNRPWPHTVIPCSHFRPSLSEIRFCLIRDPIERFVSGYSNRVLHYKEIPETTFENFVKNFDYYYKTYSAISWHLSPQVLFLGQDPEYYTHIFNTKNMSDVAEFLERISGEKVVAVREQTGGNNLKPVPNDEQKKIIRKIYKKDYEFLKRMDEMGIK